MRTNVVAVMLAGWIAGGVAGCATVDQDMAFSSEDETAFVLLAVDERALYADWNSYFRFQRIDIASGESSRAGFEVTFRRAGAADGDELPRPAEAASHFRYAGVEAPAGDYALVSRRDTTVQMTLTHCFAHEAPVYRLSAGAISMLEAPGGPSITVFGATADPEAEQSVREILSRFDTERNEALRADGEQVLAGYPEMTARRELIRPLGRAVFTTRRQLVRDRGCLSRSAFEFTPEPALEITEFDRSEPGAPRSEELP